MPNLKTNGATPKMRLLVSVCTLLFCFSWIVLGKAHTAWAETVMSKDGKWEYEFVWDDTVNIIKYHGEDEMVYIPPDDGHTTLEGYDIDKISDGAFSDCDTVHEIRICNPIDTLDPGAFRDCKLLTTVTFFADGIDTISSECFSGCVSLQSIEIPGNVTYIGEGAFNGCCKLEKLTFLPGLEREWLEIEERAFADCTSLKELILPPNLSSLESEAFAGCTSLESVAYQNNPQWSSPFAYKDCNAIHTVAYIEGSEKLVWLTHFPTGTTFFKFVIDENGFAKLAGGGRSSDKSTVTSLQIPSKVGNYEVHTISSDGFSGYTNLKSVTFSDPCYIESIEQTAFKDCTSLESITIPSTVNNLGEGCFDNCRLLRSVDFETTQIKAIPASAFENCIQLEKVTVPEGVRELGVRCFGKCFGLSEVRLPNSLTTIQKEVFAGDDKLRDIYMPDSEEDSTMFENAFLGLHESDLTFHVKWGSSAWAWLRGDDPHMVASKVVYEPVPLDDESVKVVVTSNPTYCMAKVLPQFTVTRYGHALEWATDYSVDYTTGPRTNRGDAQVDIIGGSGPFSQGSFTGRRTINFTINPAPLSDKATTMDDVGFCPWDGDAWTPHCTFHQEFPGGHIYDIKDEEYTLSFSNNTDAGTATVTIDMKDDADYRGNLTGSMSFTFTISQRDLLKDNATISGLKESYPFVGGDVTPVPTVTILKRDNVTPLELSADPEYNDITFLYALNNRPGRATILVKGNSPNLTNTAIAATFEIVAATSDYITIADIPDQVYSGKTINPKVVVSAFGSVIPEDLYSVSAPTGGNVNVGTGTAIVKGTKAQWEVSKEFKIIPLEVTVTGASVSKVYGAADPELSAWVEPEQKVAYTLSRAPGEEPGDYEITVSGDKDQGNYTVEFNNGTFTIEEANLEEIAQIQAIPEQTYTGNSVEPKVTLLRKDGGTLTEGKDYDVAYADNLDVGTATVTVTGKDAAYGELQTTFKIVPRDLAQAKLTFDSPSIEWWGGEQRCLYPTVTLDGVELKAQHDYQITFADNTGVGTAKVTASGIGNYTGTALGTYEVTPYRVVVTPDDFTKTYVDPDPALTYTLDRPLWGSDTLDVALSREPGADVGTYAIMASGETRQGSYEVTFGADGTLTIERADLHELRPSVTAPDVVYDGTDHEPIPTVQLGDMVLVYGRDFDVLGYADNHRVGKAIVYVEGIGNFKEFKAGYFQILKRPAEVRVNDYTKRFGEDDPQFTVTETNVVEGDQIPYEFSREPGEECGEYAIDVQANYQWLYTYDLTYVPGKLTITEADLSEATVTCAEQTYSGSAVEPIPTVTLNGKELEYGTDFDVKGYENNVDVGTAKVTIEGRGNYEGVASGTFEIGPLDISGEACSVGVPVQEYTGSQITPDPSLVQMVVGGNTLTLEKDVDYEVTGYGENIQNSGTVQIKGIGNFTGENEGTFRIVNSYNLDLASVSDIPDQVYSGSPIEPSFVVSLADVDLLLRRDVDYTVMFENNQDVGIAKVTVTGISPIRGTLTTSFNIVSASLADASVKADDQTFDGEELTPELLVTLGDSVLEADKDYTVTGYKDNVNVGTATVTIEGKGNYEGSASGTFEVLRRGVTVTAKDLSKRFGESDPRFAAKVVGLVGSDTVSYDFSREPGDDVGTYPIYATGEAEQGNYAVTFVDGTLTINPANLSSATITCADQTYTGSALEPAPTVTLNDKKLLQDVDYVASYDRNVDAGTAKVTITGKGNYEGTATGTFEIAPFDLSGGSCEVVPGIQIYTGEELKPVPKVTVDMGGMKITLESGRDFGVTGYKDNVTGPVGTVSIEGIGNYTGTNSGTFNIVSDTDLTLGIIEPIADQPYTGSAVEPHARVSLRGVDLLIQEGVDYTLSYENNVDVGTATVTATGIGSIKGEVSTTFQIVPTDLSAAVVTADEQTYTGSGVEPAPTVTLGGCVIPASNYTVTYEKNVNVGTADVTITAAGGNCTGSASGTFEIVPRDISGEGCEVAVAVQQYTGSQLTPDPSAVTVAFGETTLTLEKGVDYEVTGFGENIKDSGSVRIKGIGNFTGANEGTFRIVNSTDLTQGSIKAIPAQTFTGSAIEPDLVVRIDDLDMVLRRDVDYTATFEGNVNVGTAKVTVEGIAPMTGSLTATFTIVPADLSEAEVTAETQAYTGSELTPTPVVTLGGVQLVAGLDFETTGYENNVHPGSAVVRVSGIGNYSGKASGTFEISRRSIPDNVTVSQPDDVTYSGVRQLPSVIVTDGGSALRQGVDYGLVYGNNLGAGSASVSVVGRGDYEGKKTVTFEILPKAVTVTADDLGKAYGAADPTLTATVEGVVDEYAVVYDLTREWGESVGQYPIQATGEADQGNYAVTFADGTFTVRQASLASAEVSVEDQAYSASAIEPEVKVSLGDTTLVPGEDYAVRYLNNVHAGGASVVVTGAGNYRGTASGHFQIEKAQLVATYLGETIAWDGTPALTVEASGFVGGEDETTASGYTGPAVEAPQALEPGKSYELSPSGGSARDYEFSYVAGTLSVGLRPVSYEPVARTGLLFDGSEQVGVAAHEGYSVSSGSAINAGTYLAVATLDEGWSWPDGSTNQRTIRWSIAAVPIVITSHADIPDQTHTGSPCEPAVLLRYGDAVLIEGKDYKVSYADNVELGQAKAIVTGIGNFEGTLEIPFSIVEASYRLVSGPEGPVERGSAAAFTFERVGDDPATFKHFTGVKLDGRKLTAAAYDAKSGSVTVTLKPAFTETLALGDHTLTVLFDDGSAEATFSVRDHGEKPDPVIPQTDDTSVKTWVVALIAAGGVAALAIGFVLRKK